jgi:hypothetical protein
MSNGVLDKNLRGNDFLLYQFQGTMRMCSQNQSEKDSWIRHGKMYAGNASTWRNCVIVHIFGKKIPPPTDPLETWRVGCGKQAYFLREGLIIFETK